MTKPIPAPTAAAGDAFTARLVLALRDSHGKILAPAHAPVEGRLLRVENYLTSPLGAIMVLQPGTIEIRGAQIPVAAKPDPRPFPGQRMVSIVPYPRERHASLIRLLGDHPTLKAGYRTAWWTEDPGETQKNAR